MFRKILVANRGEIALRILRACRDLGIASVAIYSDADRDALHVRYADEAYRVGPSPARESYLDTPHILQIARDAGADAIHPGYGFLAENADFAEACNAAGVTFIGPTPNAIRLLGDKVAARQAARRAGVPVVEGTDGAVELDRAVDEARRIGYPILIKAAAGGGGKGMRVVDSEPELEKALRTAAMEAASAFGNGSVYLERYLSPVRHIEVQVIADNHGNVVALGERECSIQRRHQKLIEEAPSPAIEEYQRSYLYSLSTKLARSVGYSNVGTVEFLLDMRGEFRFLEMNTRLQVEHPVTEMITGLDLVADMIRTAAGEPLPYSQHAIALRGWAIECRVAAEDPFNNFLPSVGHIDFTREPAGPGIRVESGIYDGAEVSVFYDPLLAKVTAWGRDRDEALRRMRRALREFKVAGVHTNLPFLQFVLQHDRFVAGAIDTGFIERFFHPDELESKRYLAIATLVAAAVARQRRGPATTPSAPAANGHGPAWRTLGRTAALRPAGSRPPRLP